MGFFNCPCYISLIYVLAYPPFKNSIRAEDLFEDGCGQQTIGITLLPHDIDSLSALMVLCIGIQAISISPRYVFHLKNTWPSLCPLSNWAHLSQILFVVTFVVLIQNLEPKAHRIISIIHCDTHVLHIFSNHIVIIDMYDIFWVIYFETMSL